MGRALVQPASVDLRLGNSFRVFHNYRASAIDLRDPPTNLTEPITIGADEPFVIHPGEFCLGATLEYVALPDDIVARIEGKSSLGRLGLIVHATAGFCDPGWQRHADAGAQQPHARPDQAVGRACRSRSSRSWRSTRRRSVRTATPTLGSHYQGQVAATESRYGAAAARAAVRDNRGSGGRPQRPTGDAMSTETTDHSAGPTATGATAPTR